MRVRLRLITGFSQKQYLPILQLLLKAEKRRLIYLLQFLLQRFYSDPDSAFLQLQLGLAGAPSSSQASSSRRAPTSLPATMSHLGCVRADSLQVPLQGISKPTRPFDLVSAQFPKSLRCILTLCLQRAVVKWVLKGKGIN